MITDMVRPGGDAANAIVMPARNAPSPAEDSELEKQLGRLLQRPVMPDIPKVRRKRAGSSLFGNTQEESSQEEEQSLREISLVEEAEGRGPTMTCIFATKDIPKNKEIVATFRKVLSPQRDENHSSFLDWLLKHGEAVPGGRWEQGVSPTFFRPRLGMRAADHGRATDGDWRDWKLVCAGLERDTVDQHSVWKHAASNGIAAVLAKWAELYCEGRGDRAGSVIRRPGAEVSGGGNAPMQHDEL